MELISKHKGYNEFQKIIELEGKPFPPIRSTISNYKSEFLLLGQPFTTTSTSIPTCLHDTFGYNKTGMCNYNNKSD